MAIDLNHIDFVRLKESIRENPKDFVALVGSGLSCDCGLPSWNELRSNLIKDARARVSEMPAEHS